MSLNETTSDRSAVWGWSKRIGDLGLGGAVLAVVVMMVIPLTPGLIDLLIAASIGFSVLLLSLSLFIARPLAFTVFPTLLLVSTLFRLALNISSTRLILLQADAGRIIRAFGGYIVGGDILIGAVIFGILAMVLFLVISKGAERVAEVAARFSLDALPGMQLAIDSDLRLGAVSTAEAARRRDELEEQSRYFGALDGAMKFVRGDAVAGLVIIGVNIVGGVLVGTLRRGLTIGQAVDTYGRLTVGDGLVSMIPALLISTAAGLLVTRVSARTRAFGLGEQVSRQLMTEPRALAAAAVLLLSLAFVRGLPVWPFLGLSVVFGLVAANRFWAEKRRPDGNLPSDDIPTTVGGTATRVALGSALHAALHTSPSGRAWRGASIRLAENLRNRYGVPLASVPMVKEAGLLPRELVLKIRGGVSERMRVPEGAAYCRCGPDELKQVGVVSLGAGGREGVWISADDGALCNAAGLVVLPMETALVEIVSGWLGQSVSRLIGVDETQLLVDRVAAERPVLVRETVPKRIELPALASLLGKLVEEGVHLDLLPEVLETVARVPSMADLDGVVEQVRVGLGAAVTAALRDEGGQLNIMLLDDGLASVLEEGLVKTEQGVTLALDARDGSMLIQNLKAASAQAGTTVLVTEAHLRRPLSAFLRGTLPSFRVLKTSEIENSTRVSVVHEVTF